MQTPRTLSAGRPYVSARSNFPSTSGEGEGAPGGAPLPVVEVERAAPGPPAPSNVAGRRNLRNFVSRPAPTDFETWKQAEAALQAGVTVQQLVEREFRRSVGPLAVRCALCAVR
jgi:hypothetical protein